MTYNELNNFILNYLDNDITGRAIMLTGEWGSGKSYYVKNTLKPFLEEKKHKCAVVSLYGLSDISEISRVIYLELRTIRKETESEAGNTAKAVGKIVGKTLINGLTSKIGFDIGNISDKDIQKVYDSIDLSGKLIVLEDIERTQIDILELLGYINNMCENDGVKVLLVANEGEIVQFQMEEKDENGKKTSQKVFSEKAKKYLKAKEKTVGDTIFFECDYLNTIQQIIGSFGTYLQKYRNEKCAEDIMNIFVLIRSHNFRAFKYACQKTKSIFEFIEQEKIPIKDEFEKKIFYGVIAFTQRQSLGIDVKFDRGTYLSANLGLNFDFPLFRFCFDYIVYQRISKEEVGKTVKYYADYLMNGKWNSGRDDDLQIIKNFTEKTEYEVTSALANISKKIQNGYIPYHDYGIVVNYIIAIKYDAGIDFDIQPIVNSIKDMLQRINDDINFDALFSSGYSIDSEKGISHFENIKHQIKVILGADGYAEFPYTPSDIKEYCIKCSKVPSEFLYRDGFAHKIDSERFVEMLERCSADIIFQLRALFLNLYRGSQCSRILTADIKALTTLYEGIIPMKDYSGYDKIQKLQIKWFIENLREIIENLGAK